MALNKYMHTRNVYKSKKPDFKALAMKYDYFRDKVTLTESGKVVLDFKDPSALRVLTKALLEDDFGLLVTLPLDRLIPTVPQRLNYILWLEDIVGQKMLAKGIDIVKKVAEDTLLMGVVEENEHYDFSMCNPPFYTDHLEAQGITNSHHDHRPDSSTLSTASETESISWGGEVRFVTQMIEESLLLKNQIRVYTSLLGKKTSLSLLKEELQKRKVPKYSSTEFCQGKTMRWGIAWTFDESVEFPKSAFKELKNKKPSLTFEIPQVGSVLEEYTVQAYTWLIRKLLEDLKIKYFTKHSGKFYTCMILQAKENTWSHQRRKRRQQCKLSPEKLVSNTQCINIDNHVCIEKETGSSEDMAKKIDNKISNGTEDVLSENCDTNESVMEMNIINPETVRADAIDNDLVKEHINVNESGVEEMKGQKRCQNDINNDELSKQEPKRRKQGMDDFGMREVNGITECVNLSSTGDENKVDDQKCEVKNKVAELVRKDVIEQFWKEMAANKPNSGDKKTVDSFYEQLTLFDENEDCLILAKMVLQKNDGVIMFMLSFINGNKEAMHQLMQYFKNKFMKTGQ